MSESPLKRKVPDDGDDAIQRLMNAPLVLNVGGTYFTTTRDTLCKASQSMLARRFALRDADVAFGIDDECFLDADPDAFAVILRGLRHGAVPTEPPAHLHMDADEWQTVLGFYGLGPSPTTAAAAPEQIKPLAQERQESYELFMNGFVHWLERTEPLRRANTEASTKATVSFTTGIQYSGAIDPAAWIAKNLPSYAASELQDSWCKDLACRLGVKKVELHLFDERHQNRKGNNIGVLIPQGTDWTTAHSKTQPIVQLVITFP